MTPALNPRLTVNGYPFKDTPLDQALAFYAASQFPAVGLWEGSLTETGVERSLALVRQCGARVEYLIKVSMFTLHEPQLWEDETARLVAVLDAAKALGARSVYCTTGPAGSMTWEAAAGAFATAVVPALEHSRQIGVRLLVENQNPLTQGVSFVYGLHDLVKLAELSGVGVCVDLFHCWRDRELLDTFRQALPLISLVQVGDFSPGTRQLGDRRVPGDGIVPLESILGGMLEAGYEGVFDMEITGPRIEEEGRQAAFVRGAAYLSRLLDRLTGAADG